MGFFSPFLFSERVTGVLSGLLRVTLRVPLDRDVGHRCTSLMTTS